jgi:plasmid maintenance system killer protein
MRILPLHGKLRDYLRQRNLEKKFTKQRNLFEANIFHPGLETELLEPKHLRLWSFRIDRKYRAIFIFRDKRTVEIIDVNDHYQ